MVIFIIGGVFMLGLCIFIHELGHYLLGRMVGIRVEIFSIGYGKGVWKKQIGDTTWQITAIPFGGYVKFYGDDLLDPEKSKVPGGFLSASPWRRMIPVIGGPLFNLLLGFLLFVIIHTISGPLSPRVFIWEEMRSETPAYRGGLRNGDVVKKIDGQPIKDFSGIQQAVAFSAGAPLKFEVLRNSKPLEFTVVPEVTSAGTALIGLRTPGERFLEVSYPITSRLTYPLLSSNDDSQLPSNLRAMPYLHHGDVILSVNGEEVRSIIDLQQILGRYHNQKVKIKVRRQILPWLTPLYGEEVVVETPSRGEYRINLTEIVDLKYNTPVADQSIVSLIPEFQRGLAFFKINGNLPGSFENINQLYSQPTRVQVEIENRKYSAVIHSHKIGVLGFQADNRIESEYLERSESFGEIIGAAFNDTWKNIALYPEFFKKLFTGRMSFIDNAIGPVGMFAVSGTFIKSGLLEYLYLMAAISIALMVMNLIPFPIVDGGHLLFFLYEGVVGKPIPLHIMELMHRLAFSTLLMLGLWIMYRDIMRFVL